MDGILEKFCAEAERLPERKLYNFLDCSTEPFAEHIVTSGEAWQRASGIAAELLTKGAKKGDRAIILSLQDEGTVYAVWGCMMIGVVFTLIPPPLDKSKLNRFVAVLKSCGPKFLISNAALEQTNENNPSAALLRQAFFQVVTLKRIYTDRVKPYQGPSLLCRHEADDLLYLQYTSGSTSAPKGVMVTYKNLMACIHLCMDIFDFKTTHQSLVSWVPFYHNIGLVVAIFMPAYADRALAHHVPTLQFLEKPVIWLKALSRYQATITAAPNSAYELCTRLVTPSKAARYDLSRMERLINGSETVNPHTVDAFCELFHISRDAFAPGYGLSECVCVAALSSRDYRSVSVSVEDYHRGKFSLCEHGEKQIVSVGRPAADMKIVTVHSDMTPCQDGEIGEICLQGSNVCAGYWKDPEESRAFETVIPGYSGSFYRTGDMGAIYQGQLYLTGRIKEMIIIGGKNIFPSDTIIQLQAEGFELPVSSMAVFSVERRGKEQPVFCAECRPDADFARLAAQVNRIISAAFGFSFKDVVFVREGTLPRTDNRKIQTLETKNVYNADRLQVLFSTLRHKAEKSAASVSHNKIEISPYASPEEIRPVIQNIFESLLPGVDFGPEDSFLELGGDSLGMMELICSLENELGVTIDLREIAASPTVADISQYLSDLLNGRSGNYKTDLRAECVLDPDIAPQSPYFHQPENCRKILVTGTTGFLGAYLVRELICRRKSEDVTVYCHGRGATADAVMNRIEQNMRRFRCWDDSFRKYIVPVSGDLGQPRLGIEYDLYQKLADSVDMVIHNGAVLNFILPYRQLKRVNVTGTAEALRFACTGRAKYFHYISSYSVYDNPSCFQRRVTEDDPLESSDGYFLGYSETKWVAEKLVGIARERGLRTTVYRPGDITGTSLDGIWKVEDLISRSIVGCIQMGSFPEIQVNLHLTPVDFVAASIVRIAFQAGCVNHAFNILNERLMPVEQFYRLLRKLGYKIDHQPFDQWCGRLESCSSEENVLRVLSCLFTGKQPEGEDLITRFGVRQAIMDTSNTKKLLAESGIDCPPVDDTLMERYLTHFSQCGYIPMPVHSGLFRRFVLRLMKKGGATA